MRVICRHLSKLFETRSEHIWALKDVGFQVEEKEFLCVLGPSGCGKTTLLRIIAGLLEPSSGKVTLRDSSSFNGPATAMVFQEYGVLPWLNVIDNVCFGLEMRGITKKKRYHIATPFIDKLGLTNFIKSYPHQLSSGMKQRVGLARALVSGAEILLMDEPFAALDAQMRLISQEQLLGICREHGKSVIYVTHDIEEAMLLADRIILMTARPGQVKDIVRIPFTRPREINSDIAIEFAKMKNNIWSQIKEEVLKSIQSTS